jgi:hypothetical protein
MRHPHLGSRIVADAVRYKDAAWTQRQMQQAEQRFSDFSAMPHRHGAAGWQMNGDAFRQLDSAGMQYASDGRAC